MEALVQKLVGIAQGREQMIWVIERSEEDAYREEFDDEDFYGENFEEEKTTVNGFVSDLLGNTHLNTQQIENVMNILDDSRGGSRNWTIQSRLYNHPNTPLWILEKIYEDHIPYMDNSVSIIFNHPNASQELKERIQKDIQKNQEKNKKVDEGNEEINKKNIEVNAILQKHPNLDTQQVLQYYENKQDTIIARKIAEYIYNDDVLNDPHGM